MAKNERYFLMKDRILSVDIFRGMTIVLMILVNTPGTWSAVYAPLLHAEWHGYTSTDLVFPFFLFIVGTSIVFAYQNKKPSAQVYKKITIRSLKLIGLGIFLGAFTISFPFIKEFSEIRFPGVLQRILSTIPSIVSSLLGVFTGLILISNQKKKATLLFGLGGCLLILGHIWNLFFPINKALWTSSFVLATAGWANVVLALIYYLTDIRKIQFGSIFRYAGANAIVIYFLSSFITKLFYLIKVDEKTSLHGWLFQNIFVHDFLSMQMSSLLYGLSVVAFYCLAAYVLYKRRIFIKV